jgi:4-hydroxybenzoate polyprenyltransferase
MQPYQFIRILSLDVVAGACISTLFIAKSLGVLIPPIIVISLGLTVWIIYTLDHLLDARYIPHTASTARHRFHQKYFSWIATVLIVTLLCAGICLYYLPEVTLRFGVLLTIAVMIYFVLLQVFRKHNTYLKEISIGLIYTLGLFLGPVSIMDHWELVGMGILFVQFFARSTANLMIFAYFEYEIDQKDGHGSLVRSLGAKRVKRFCLFLTLLVIFMSLIPASATFGYSRWILLFMGLILAMLVMKPSFFRKNETYRVLGDGIFLLPMAIL